MAFLTITSKYRHRKRFSYVGGGSSEAAARADQIITTRGTLLASEPPLWYTSWCWEELRDRWEQGRHREGPMSRAPLHALIWSSEQGLYELYTQGQIEQRFQSAEETAWLARPGGEQRQRGGKRPIERREQALPLHQCVRQTRRGEPGGEHLQLLGW